MTRFSQIASFIWGAADLIRDSFKRDKYQDKYQDVIPHFAMYLDAKTVKQDVLAGRTEEQIARLREYRTALIAAAVTGAIDVRGQVAGDEGGADGERESAE